MVVDTKYYKIIKYLCVITVLMVKLDTVVCVKLSEKKVKKMDELIAIEKFYSRSAILRDALNEFLEHYDQKTIVS